VASLKRLPTWCWLLLIAALPRFINLGAEALWYDESFTAWLVKLDLPSMLRAIAGDTHPPLWYFIEWLNVRLFGTSEFALRLPAAMLGVACVLLIWQVALAAGLDRRTAFVAGLLSALLPSMLYYSQEARMYMLLTVCVLLALWGVLNEDWVIFVLGGVGAGYSQDVGLIYIACIAFLMEFMRFRHPIRAFIAVMVVVMAWMPWGLVLNEQVQRVGQSFWLEPLTPIGVIWPMVNMTMGWRLPDTLQIHVYGAALGATVIGLIATRRWLRTQSGLLILTTLFVVPILVALVSLTWRSIYMPRALLPSALLLILFWAYALTHLSLPNRRIAQLILIPALLAGTLSHYWPAGQSGRFDMRTWVAPALAQWRSGDVAYFTSAPFAITVRYYLDKPYQVRPYTADLNQSFNEDCKTAMQLEQGSFDDLPRQGFRRAWLFVSLNPLSSQAEHDDIARILRAYPQTLVKRQPATNAEVAIYLVSLSEGVVSNDVPTQDR
jgi:4-amino-4-deoxy-L-arabinose transferase-like glycosyltransferase